MEQRRKAGAPGTTNRGHGRGPPPPPPAAAPAAAAPPPPPPSAAAAAGGGGGGGLQAHEAEMNPLWRRKQTKAERRSSASLAGPSHISSASNIVQGTKRRRLSKQVSLVGQARGSSEIVLIDSDSDNADSAGSDKESTNEPFLHCGCGSRGCKVFSSGSRLPMSSLSPSEALKKVLAFFPQAKRSWVVRGLKKCRNNARFLIQVMTENGFPAEPVKTPLPQAKKIPTSINYRSKDPEKRPPKTILYVRLCRQELFNRFKETPKKAIERIMAENNSFLWPSVVALEKAIAEKNADGTDKLRKLTNITREVTPLGLVGSDAVFQRELDELKKAESRRRSEIDIIVERRERERAKHLRREEKRRQSEAMLKSVCVKDASKDDKEVIIRGGSDEVSLHEETTCCIVCYEDVTNDIVTQCFAVSPRTSSAASSSSSHEAHPICGPCLGTHVSGLVSEQQIGENPHIPCVVPDCTAQYSEVFLKRAVAPSIMDKRDELARNWNLEKMERDGAFTSGPEKLVRCPVCAYPAVAPKGLKVFECPSVECQAKSCLLCKKPSHVPLSCDEANTETLTEKIHRQIAEAMTNAVVRNCPECNMPILKDEGCNKIHCKKCDVFSCYLCHKQLSATVRGLKRSSKKYKSVRAKAYAHFCQTPHCDHSSCNKCILFDKNKEEDKIKSREAGEAAAQEARDHLVKKCGKSVAEARAIVGKITSKLMEGLPGVPKGRSSSASRPSSQKSRKKQKKKKSPKRVKFADANMIREAVNNAVGQAQNFGYAIGQAVGQGFQDYFGQVDNPSNEARQQHAYRREKKRRKKSRQQDDVVDLS